MIIETDRLEQEMDAGTTFLDIFNKINRRRTEIATGVYTIQVLSGIYLIGERPDPPFSWCRQY